MTRRQFKPRQRGSGFRDARLIIIATEGEKTEPRYFQALVNQYHNPKVHVEILERTESAASPEDIIRLLDKFRRDYALNDFDELWLVIDLDRWGDKKLSEIATQCAQKQYDFAVSNPCFEIWLLLHIKSLDDYTDDEKAEFFENKKSHDRTRLELELIKLLGSYNKSNLEVNQYIPQVAIAISRAETLDTQPTHRWTNHLGTRVYKLAKSIIEKTHRT